jgi:autotransporter-associated beta strand protein
MTTDGSSASLRIDSGSLTVGGALTIGDSTSTRWAVVDVNGGTLTSTDPTTGIDIGGVASGDGLLLVRAGTATANKLTFGVSGNTASSVLNITGGSVYVGSGGMVQASGYSVTPTITLGGTGILGASANWSSSLAITLAGGTIQAANASSVSKNITLSGILSGSTLTQTGNGILTLGGANTYSGNTTNSAGTLLVNNTSGSGTGSGTVTITNSTLGGTGTISGATLMQPNAVLAAGISGTGILHFGNALTLDPASTNLFAVTTAGGASNSVAVTGVLSINNSVISIKSGTPLHHTTATLFNYTGGSDSGTFNPSIVFDVAPPAGATIVDTGSLIQLVVTNIPPVAGATFTNYVTLGAPSTVQIVGGKYAPTDADGDALTITITGAPANGTAGTDGTNITYTATGGTSDSLTYTVSDGFGGTATQTIYYVISGPAPSQNQLAPTMVAGQQVLNFAGIPNYNYALDETHDLTPPITWTPVITNTVGPSGKLLFTNAPSGGNDYYRTRYVP